MSDFKTGTEKWNTKIQPNGESEKKKAKNTLYEIENGGEIIKAMQVVPQKITKILVIQPFNHLTILALV